MVPFKTPSWRKKIIREKYNRKRRLISNAVQDMEVVMEHAVDYILEHYSKTGRFAAPSLQSMYGVSLSFYHELIYAAFYSAKLEKEAQKEYEPTAKRLARLPVGMPKTLPGLEKIFRDKRYWPKIMKRSTLITDRVRRKYLGKLQAKFRQILPKLDSGELTPKDARSELLKEWETSKSRVELIFRTETTTYFGKAQVAFFQGDSEIIGFLFDSTADKSRTEWCRSRHGLIYRPGTKELRENTPACHYNCRSILIPLANTPYNRKLLEDPQRDPNNRRVEPLLPGWRK